MTHTSRLSIVMALAAIIVLGCQTAVASPGPSICNGVSSDIGGCDPDLPTYTGTTCRQLSAEYAGMLEREMLAVLAQPAEVGGEARSVRSFHREVLLTSRLTDRMLELDLIPICDLPDFMLEVDATFSDEFKTRVGALVNDGAPPNTYNDWRTELLRLLSGIDTESER